MAFLSIKNVSKVFDSQTALKNVSIDIEKGELISILGPSGCGKTTLLLSLIHISPYYADQIEAAADGGVVRPNSGNLCCGEGVCGACAYDDEAGKTVHRCKERR